MSVHPVTFAGLFRILMDEDGGRNQKHAAARERFTNKGEDPERQKYFDYRPGERQYLWFGEGSYGNGAIETLAMIPQRLQSAGDKDLLAYLEDARDRVTEIVALAEGHQVNTVGELISWIRENGTPEGADMLAAFLIANEPEDPLDADLLADINADFSDEARKDDAGLLAHHLAMVLTRHLFAEE